MAGGFIMKSIQYSIYCNDCDEFEDYKEISRPSAVFRKLGWVKDKNDIWRCAKCAEKLSVNKSMQRRIPIRDADFNIILN